MWQILICWDSEKGKALGYVGLKASKGGTVSLLLSSSLEQAVSLQASSL